MTPGRSLVAGDAAPEFSVVVPAYNATRTVAATIRSVLYQTDPDFELIVVDDGSTDDTTGVVERTADGDPRLRLVRQPNAGTGAARNTGIAHARGRCICLLDNDDLWMPSYLAAVRAAFDGAPDAGLAYSDAWILDDATHRIHRRTGLAFFAGNVPARLDGERFLLELLKQNFVTASTVTLRREVTERIGGFDASVRGVDDYDLWLRIAAAGFGAVRPAGCRAILRDRAGSLSKDQAMMMRSLHDVLQRAASNVQLHDAARAVVEARLRAVDVSVRALEQRADPAALGLRVRRTLARLKARLRKPFDLRLSAPPEVAAALHAAGER